MNWSTAAAAGATGLPSWRVAFVGWVLVAVAFGAVAQAADEASAPRSAPAASGSAATPPSKLTCLVQGDPKDRPRYRTSDAQFHREYTVRVVLTFRSGPAAPDVEVLYSNADEHLLDDVRGFVMRYRLPCLADGARPVVAQQDFNFVEEARPVVWMPLREADDWPDFSRCLRDGNTPRDREAHYPSRALKDGRGGSVLVDMTFTEPDGPPSVVNLYVGGGKGFAEAADALASNYRLPCLPKGASFEMRQMFDFGTDAETRYAFKDMKLAAYLGLVEHIEIDRQRFDFTTMGCPFDLRMHWYQPYATNMVGEIGGANPNRREFIVWLRSLALAMPDKMKQQLLGQPFTISVPCGTLDLTS